LLVRILLKTSGPNAPVAARKHKMLKKMSNPLLPPTLPSSDETSPGLGGVVALVVTGGVVCVVVVTGGVVCVVVVVVVVGGGVVCVVVVVGGGVVCVVVVVVVGGMVTGLQSL